MTRRKHGTPRPRGLSAIAIYDPATFTDPQQAALIAARADGCTCNPEISIKANAGNGDIGHATIRHDDWCALLRRGDVN